jgi:hypothetical protein
LTDEQRRALRILARHPDGCAEAVLLAHGFSYDLLGDLVFDRLATLLPTVSRVAGREKIVVWNADHRGGAEGDRRMSLSSPAPIATPRSTA